MFGQLRSVLGHASVSVHLVEVSPTLSLIQAQTLTGGHQVAAGDQKVYRRGETVEGLAVRWYSSLEDVSEGTHTHAHTPFFLVFC